jgi:hypothetical protein
MDKPILSSMMNQGSILGVIGAALMLVGEPLLNKEITSVWEIVGICAILIGTLMWSIGFRRVKGNALTNQKEIIDGQERIHQEQLKVLLSIDAKLNACSKIEPENEKKDTI